MEISLRNFKQRIDFLQKQLSSQESVTALRNKYIIKQLNKEDLEHLNKIIANRTDEKLYHYTANIIHLYGGLESFIEAIVEEYLKSLSTLYPSYQSMKETSNIWDYMSQGIALLKHAENRKFKTLSKKEVLKSLYGAIINDDSSALHSEAYIDLGGGNYKHDTIMKYLSRLGVKDISGKLKDFNPLKRYIADKGVDATLNIYTKIDDLVERRNELAHGTNTPELLDSEYFSEYLSFFNVYAETINNYMNNQLNAYGWMLVKSEEIMPRVYSNNIICLKSEQVAVGTEFSKGQQLLILRDGKYYQGVIDNIQVDQIDLEYYKKVDNDVEIGLKISSICNIKKKSTIKFK